MQLFVKWISWNPDRWSNIHVQGHIKTVPFLALKISWYKSLPQLKSKKKRLQRNDAIWVFGFLLSVLCLRNQAGLLSHPRALLILDIHCEAKEQLTSAGTGQHLAESSGKISYDYPGFHGSRSGLRILSCREGSWNQGLAVLHDDPDPWSILEMGVGRETCQSSPPPNWSEKQDNQKLDFYVPKISFFIHEAQTIPHKKQTFKFRKQICISVQSKFNPPLNTFVQQPIWKSI